MRSVLRIFLVFTALVTLTPIVHAQAPSQLFPNDWIPYSGCYSFRCFENVLAFDRGTAVAGLQPLVTVSTRGPVGWVIQQDIYNPDVRPPRTYVEGERRVWPPFASAVGLSGDELLIAGSSAKYNFKEVVYVFARANGTWTHSQTLVLARPSGFDQTIVSHVAVDGSIALITGTRYDDENPDATFIQTDFYVRTSPGQWQRRGSFKPPSGSTAEYATSMDLSGNLAVFGDPAAGGSGRAFLFEYTRGLWIRRSTFAATTPVSGSRFGEHVAISGNAVAVAAPEQPTATWYLEGAVHLFAREAGVWRPAGVVVEPTYHTPPEYEDDIRTFGTSLSMDGERIIVGAQRGAFADLQPHAYLLEPLYGWRIAAGLTNYDALFSGRVFVSGSTAIVEGSQDWGDRSGFVFELPLVGQLP